MVLQSLLLIACDLDSAQQTEEAGGRSNGAGEPVAACLPRLKGYRAGDMAGRIAAQLSASIRVKTVRNTFVVLDAGCWVLATGAGWCCVLGAGCWVHTTLKYTLARNFNSKDLFVIFVRISCCCDLFALFTCFRFSPHD